MIVYKNILERLKAAGYNTNRLRQEKRLPESTIQAIRSGKPITTKSIDTICLLLMCKPGDILDFVPDADIPELEIQTNGRKPKAKTTPNMDNHDV